MVEEEGQSTLPEDFVCASDEDLIRWLGNRQKGMNDALMAGNVGEVPRMVVLVNEGTNQLWEWIGQSGAEGSACVRPWWGQSSGESEVAVGRDRHVVARSGRK